MGKKNTKGTQKINPVMDASIAAPPYETAVGVSNTEEARKIKHDKNIDLHSCKCVNKKTNNNNKNTRTWASITNLYGNADTTKVWDNHEQKPKAIDGSKLHKEENPTAIIEGTQNNDIIYPTSNIKSKSAKLSLFTLYRKRKNNDNKIKIGSYVNEESKHTDTLPYPEPKMIFRLRKKPKKGLQDHYATGDVCTEGPCREALENLYNLHALKYTPNTNQIYKKKNVTKSGNNNNKDKKENKETKILTEENKFMKNFKTRQAKEIKTTKDRNVGYGDQVTPSTLQKQDLMNVQRTSSFIEKIMRHKLCKCKNGRKIQASSNVNNQNGDPFLEMKVNSIDMRVINSSEFNEKIRKLGRIEKNLSCICPSRMNGLNSNKVCDRGFCERALKNKHTHFHCNCLKQNILECKDSTCDLKVKDMKLKSINKKRSKSRKKDPVYKENKKPLFEVMLDSTNMNIINSNEFKDIIKKTSQNNIICPTGICNTLSKQNDIQIYCKCIGKKLPPAVNECEKRTCRKPEKKCRICYLCSRVFSKSENLTREVGYRKRRHTKGNGINVKRDDVIVRSHTHCKRNGVMINLPRGQTLKKGTYMGGRLSDAWYKCLCECPQKQPKHKALKKKKINKKNKKPKKKVSRRRKKRGFFRKKKKDHRTLSEKILDCLDREREHCEEKVNKKTKKYKKSEKKSIKENKIMVAEQKEEFKSRQHQWNCLTNFIAGVLNIGFGSVRTAFKVIFSLIGDPIGSFIYVREKSKDPQAAIIRILGWFVRTWKNRSSVIAKRMEESTTMNIIADQIENSVVYNALFAPKGKSQSEKMLYERRSRMRKRRMQKRQDEALYGCRHMLLTTMRKTPCLWFYHICPDLYPQCLSLSAFMNNFFHIILYLVAIICWTPCIVTFEMCRVCMCCFFCTH